jgi:hypothetical protein
LVFFWQKALPEQIESAKQIPFIIFGEKSYSNPEKLIRSVGMYYIQNGIPAKEQCDMIVINNHGILYNSRKNDCLNNPQNNRGLFYVQYDINTLAVLLFHLNQFPQSEMRIGTSVLEYYFKLEEPQKALVVYEINEKLNEIG